MQTDNKYYIEVSPLSHKWTEKKSKTLYTKVHIQKYYYTSKQYITK